MNTKWIHIEPFVSIYINLYEKKKLWTNIKIHPNLLCNSKLLKVTLKEEAGSLSADSFFFFFYKVKATTNGETWN